MIVESVVCVLLHCSRCNRVFREDANDEWEGVAHFDTVADITDQFAKGLGEYGGWRKFGDRFVCSRCQASHGDGVGFADDTYARENPHPLPPAEADKVARAQALIAQAERHVVDLREDGWTVMHPLSCRPNLFDCDVNKAADRDLDKPPAELGRFVCGLDGDGQFTIGQRALERAS
jgi:hypothetical protein